MKRHTQIILALAAIGLVNPALAERNPHDPTNDTTAPCIVLTTKQTATFFNLWRELIAKSRPNPCAPPPAIS